MDTLTVKIPPELSAELDGTSRRLGLTRSELVRRALMAYIARAEQAAFVSALEMAGDVVGCFEGGPKDLASNPKHLEGFGRK